MFPLLAVTHQQKLSTFICSKGQVHVHVVCTNDSPRFEQPNGSSKKKKKTAKRQKVDKWCMKKNIHVLFMKQKDGEFTTGFVSQLIFGIIIFFTYFGIFYRFNNFFINSKKNPVISKQKISPQNIFAPLIWIGIPCNWILVPLI